MTLITSLFILVSWAASTMFVLVYGLSAPWWRSNTGKHFFLFGVVLFEVTSLGTMTALFGADWIGRPVVRLVVWAQIAFILVWRVWILLAAQFRREHDGSIDGDSAESAHR